MKRNDDIHQSILKHTELLEKLKSTISKVVQTDYGYASKEFFFIFGYKQHRDDWNDYLELPLSEQVDYSELHAMLTRQYQRLARLYAQDENYYNAVEFEYIALSRGRIACLFETNSSYSQSFQTSSAYHQGLSYLFGIGNNRNYDAAFEKFHESIESYPKESHLLMGLMEYYGLIKDANHEMAKQHFKNAHKLGLALGSQYLAICEMEQGHSFRANHHMRAALKACLPQAQTIMSLMQKRQYGMFFQSDFKARKNLILAEIQRPYLRNNVPISQSDESARIKHSLYETR